MHTKKQICFECYRKTKKMINGTLGIYPHKKVHIDNDLKAKPVHARPYPYLESI
jgi:hypothetical protein